MSEETPAATEEKPAEQPTAEAPEPAPDPKPEATPEAKPEDTPQATPAGDTPEAKDGEKPEPSAFDTLTESLTDPDDIEASIARLREKLPEDRRTPPPPDTSAEDAMVAQQRRTEEKRQNEANRDGALASLNGHLRERKVHFLSDDAKPTDDYDITVLNGAIDDLVAAEISLADNQVREAWKNAIQSRIMAHGGSIPEDKFKQIVSDVAQQKVPDGIIGAFLDTLFQRGYAEGLEEGVGTAKSTDEGWRRSETAAANATAMKGKEMEPESTGPAASPGDDQGRLDRLSGFAFDSNGKAIPETVADREWFKARKLG